ncbi:hypothetical protein [Amphritea japonica]|uniref:hypothetical protein n=1 Tax=Amphritea japonica TaxID=452627 RepID=UPI000378D382|nr:hypothetical protein [Amphritea japonica]
MSAGIPLFILSALASVILVLWSRGGAGDKSSRIKIAVFTLAILVASWVALLSLGVFHPVGLWGMSVGFIISIASLFVPVVYNKVRSNENT